MGRTTSKTNGQAATSENVSDYMDLRDELIAELRRAGDTPAGCAALLSEVATALLTAAKLRAEAMDNPFTRSERSGRAYAHPGIALADVEVRRAALLLSRVDAMVKALPRKEPEEAENDPFAELDEVYSLAPRRRAAR
jgi:hypothetical protein